MSLNVFATAIKLAAERSCQPRCNLCSELDPTNREAERDDHLVQDSIAAVGEAVFVEYRDCGSDLRLSLQDRFVDSSYCLVGEVDCGLPYGKCCTHPAECSNRGT